MFEVVDLKILVVYYTRTGNTRFVAETLAANMGADIEEVIDLKKRSGTFAYLTGGGDARRGKETDIAPTKRMPADYELVVVGSPVWAGRPAPAITTYLKRNDLSGKKVAVFFTKGGKGLQTAEQIRALAPNSVFIGELTISNPQDNKEETEKQIDLWCKTLVAA